MCGHRTSTNASSAKCGCGEKRDLMEDLQGKSVVVTTNIYEHMLSARAFYTCYITDGNLSSVSPLY